MPVRGRAPRGGAATGGRRRWANGAGAGYDARSMRRRHGGGGTAGSRSPAQAALAGGPARTTTIERGCEIEGDLRLPGALFVHGDFRGSIDCDDVVTIGHGGSVQARIRARSVVIVGSVVGDVEARRDVVLHTGARLHGDVRTPSLVIERGAFFNGRTEMAPPLPRRPYAAVEAAVHAVVEAAVLAPADAKLGAN